MYLRYLSQTKSSTDLFVLQKKGKERIKKYNPKILSVYLVVHLIWTDLGKNLCEFIQEKH